MGRRGLRANATAEEADPSALSVAVGHAIAGDNPDQTWWFGCLMRWSGRMAVYINDIHDIVVEVGLAADAHHIRDGFLRLSAAAAMAPR